MGKANVKSNRFGKIYMDKDLKEYTDKIYMNKNLKEDNFYQIIYQVNEKKMIPAKFYSMLPNEILPFYDGNDRTCKILFSNVDEINKLIVGYKKINNKLKK